MANTFKEKKTSRKEGICIFQKKTIKRFMKFKERKRKKTFGKKEVVRKRFMDFKKERK